MKIMLIDIDSKIPNLALKKIEKYYLDKGDEVVWNNPVMAYFVDKIYVSCIFINNRYKCVRWEKLSNAEIGGTGYDIYKKLPDEIENIKPRINWGFTMRGCMRKCEFCVVPRKEGKLRIVGDIYDIWDGKAKKIVIMDNNILANVKHFKKICYQLMKEKIKVDFNQGLDHRILTKEIATLLKQISHTEYYFAFDELKSFKTVERAITILQKCGIRRSVWYILTGFNTKFSQDLFRCNYLRSRGQQGYVQKYDSRKPIKAVTILSNWVNAHLLFYLYTFDEYLEKRGERFKKIIKDELEREKK